MRDQLLFAVAPYVAALVLVPIGAAQYARWRSRPRPSPSPVAIRGDRLLRFAWLAALAIVTLGHVLAIVFPESLLAWNRQLSRLVLLEISGALAGTLATAGLLAALVRLVRAHDGEGAPSPMASAARTLVLVGMSSGLASAVSYRWASSWSEVTLVPYLYSLARLDPAPALVTHLPFLVKLHVVCAFAILAVLPFTGMIGVASAPFDRVTRAALSPIAALARTARAALALHVTPHAETLRARVLRDNAEEN